MMRTTLMGENERGYLFALGHCESDGVEVEVDYQLWETATMVRWNGSATYTLLSPSGRELAVWTQYGAINAMVAQAMITAHCDDLQAYWRESVVEPAFREWDVR